MNPTEGTILTVARLAAEAARIAADVENDPIIVLGAACNAAEDALAQTPELLHVLKKAGVVDAGGKGLCIIFEGMLSLLRDGVMINIDAPVEVKRKIQTISLRMLRLNSIVKLISHIAQNLLWAKMIMLLLILWQSFVHILKELAIAL